MTQDELMRRLAKDANLFLYQARNAIETLVSVIEEEVVAGNSVKLNHFGIFDGQDYAQRVGRNPATGEQMVVPARRKLVFKPTKRLWNLEKSDDNEERDAC